MARCESIMIEDNRIRDEYGKWHNVVFSLLAIRWNFSRVSFIFLKLDENISVAVDILQSI